MNSLFRFYAARRFAVLCISWLLAWTALQIVGGPPSHLEEWPPVARSALSNLVGGTLAVGQFVWLYLLLKPLAGRAHCFVLLRWLALGASAFRASQGMILLLTGFVTLLNVEAGGLIPVTWNWLRVAGVPVAIGLLPTLLLELREYISSDERLHRWLTDGSGHIAGWASIRKIRKMAEPLLTSTVVGGYYGCGVILGKVKTEDAYDNRLMVVHKSTPHIVTIAQPGGGKHIGAMPTYCSYRGSIIAISNKPEIVDQVLGGRVDPNTLPAARETDRAGTYGVDPRGVTQTTAHLPKGKAYLLDYNEQSVYGTNTHPLLSEIDINSEHAQIFAIAIADGSHPELPNVSSDPWFREGPRNAQAAAILHFLSSEVDPRKRNLPYVVERLMGFDQFGGEPGPEAVQQLLMAMVKNRHPVVGAFVATTAVQILELGSRSYGCLKSGIQTNCAWMFEPHLRKQLTGVAHFSYQDVGDDQSPLFVGHVLPRGDAALRSALPLLRAHAELCLQILQNKRNRPEIPTLFVADEGRQYLQGVQSIAKSPTLLRDARVKLWLMFQSWPSVVQTLGQAGADELEACSTMQYFAINDQSTAEKISRRLGQFTASQRQGLFGPKACVTNPLKTPAEVLRELSINSSMCYVMGGGMPPIRLERLSFKPLVTREGAKFQGLPLQGQYDEGLSRYTYGGVKSI